MTGPGDRLLGVLQCPARAGAFSIPDWDSLLREARGAGLMPRLAAILDEAVPPDAVPARAREHLEAARRIASRHETSMRWEVDRLQRALRCTGVEPILLKGAAYVLAGLPAGRGRTASDVDLLVPRELLEDVERSLLAEGWAAVKLDPYDQRYYRTWMHELPPLRHRRRGTLVDVHHNLLPDTARRRPEPAELLRAAVPIGNGLHVLSPEDMTLHAAAHLFDGGNLVGGLRDLTDLDLLLRHFAARTPGFWDRLAARAGEQRLGRPLHYATRCARVLLGTPVPPDAERAIRAFAPPAPLGHAMEAIASRALRPGTAIAGSEWALGLLYIRSHWIRMPPWLLTRHLARKAWRRTFAPDEA